MTRKQYRAAVKRQAWMCLVVSVCMAAGSALFVAALMAHHLSGR